MFAFSPSVISLVCSVVMCLCWSLEFPFFRYTCLYLCVMYVVMYVVSSLCVAMSSWCIDLVRRVVRSFALYFAIALFFRSCIMSVGLSFVCEFVRSLCLSLVR